MTTLRTTEGLREAEKLKDQYLSFRAKSIESLERYVEGTQYDHLPDFFSEKKPLWERAPCIVYPIVKAAIDSNVDLLLGENRFPGVKVAGLNPEESEVFESTIAEILRQSRLKAVAREVFAAAQAAGSACAIFGVRANRLAIDTVLARWCEPKFAPDGSVESVEIRYPYLNLERTSTGERWVCRIYRRTVDALTDVTYKPALAPENGKEPSWTRDVEIVHGLGFCPVLWYAHMKGCSVVNDFDGKAIHEHLTDEIRAHDFALSQRHRAALYAGDPQWTEIGVEPGFNPTGGGRKAEVPASMFGRPGETSTGSYVLEPSGTTKARKKTPGTVWQYPGKNPEVSVKLHTLPGDALQALDSHARDLRDKLCESLGVVFIDLSSLPNESRISGRALESTRARQLARINNYRSDFGDKFLVPAVGMLLRVALAVGSNIRNLDRTAKILGRLGERWSWQAPPVELTWGAYFKPSGEEEDLLIRSAVTAKEGGLATTRILVEKLRDVLGIKDIDAYLVMLEAEQQKQQEMAERRLQVEAQAKAAAAGPKGGQNDKDAM